MLLSVRRSLLAILLAIVVATSHAQKLDLSRYKEFEEIVEYLNDVARNYPHIVQLKQIGFSHERRPLLGLKIGNPPQSVNKPAVYVDGGNHAREWPAFHVAMYIIDKIVNGYGTDRDITNYVDKMNIYVFPVLNPDGYIFSRSSSNSLIKQWRKNRAPPNCTGVTAFNKKDVCCEGVDLNRNFDVAFRSTSYPFNNPCSDEYQGATPFSEPESRAFRDFFLSAEAFGSIKAVVSFHTHGQLFILPFNYKKGTYPVDYDDLLAVAHRSAEAIRAVHGTSYRVGTVADMLRVTASGSASDWVKLRTRVKYVYTIELPPELRTSFAFQMRPHWLVPTGQETWAGVKVVMDQVVNEFAGGLKVLRI